MGREGTATAGKAQDGMALRVRLEKVATQFSRVLKHGTTTDMTPHPTRTSKARGRSHQQASAHCAACCFFLPNTFGSPTFFPRRCTLSTLSRSPRIFSLGAAPPRSKSASTVGVWLILAARSRCVIGAPLSFLASARAFLMASPTAVPTVLGLTMSSDRSTLVRCWPSAPPFCDWTVSLLALPFRGLGGRAWGIVYLVRGGELLLRDDGAARPARRVEGRLAAEDLLLGRRGAATHLAADLGHRVPAFFSHSCAGCMRWGRGRRWRGWRMALGLESESLERMEERVRSLGKTSWFCRRWMVGVRWRNPLIGV